MGKNALGFYLPKVSENKKNKKEINMYRKMYTCNVSRVVAQTAVDYGQAFDVRLLDGLEQKRYQTTLYLKRVHFTVIQVLAEILRNSNFVL